MHVTQRAINTYTMHSAKVNARKATSPKFHVGDKVRITRKEGTFEKGFTPNWTKKVFTVSSVKATKPPTYTIMDTLGEPVQGTFYEQELQECTGTFSYRASAQEKEKSSICEVERLQ